MITELCDEQKYDRCVIVTHLKYKSNSNYMGATPVALKVKVRPERPVRHRVALEIDIS